MRTLFLAALFCTLAAPLRAMDEGASVEFGGQALKQRLVLPADKRTGRILWDSGPSDAVPDGFKALLLEGFTSRPGISFEASLFQSADWGPWTTAEETRFGGGRFWAKIAVSGGKGALVRLRAVDVNGPTSSAAQVEFFGLQASQMESESSNGLATSPAPPAPAPPSAASPPGIHPRSEWGALPASTPYAVMTPMRISVHHTEERQPMTREAAIEELRAIQSFHQHGRGWIDIGYHFLIDGSGEIWEGRPLPAIGAHVKDNNEGNIGVSLMGDFHPPKNHTPTPAQIQSLVTLLRWLTAAYHIPVDKILGHRDQEQTACPGKTLYALLDKIRDAVGEPQAPAGAPVRKTEAAATRVHSLAPSLPP